MAGRLYAYASVSAKIRAMARALLTQNDYKQLLSKNSVREIAAYLKSNTSYASVLHDVLETDIHRSRLESLLRLSSMEEFSRLIGFTSGDNKKFLRIFIIGYEIELIKLMIRTVNREMKLSINVSDYYEKHMTIDVDKLFAAQNFVGVIESLKDTQYEKVLSPFLKGTDYLNIFNIEMTLDVYYYKVAWSLKDKLLKGEDKALVADTLGREIDLLNLMFIIRSKRYYQTSKEYMYAFILPIRYKLTEKQIKLILEAPTVEQSMELIETTAYKGIFKNDPGRYMEEEYHRYNYHNQYKNFRQNPYTIGALIGYMHIKELEIRNLVMIIEGIRYNQEKEIIEKYLVGR